MKNLGIVRKLDDLGRIVIPKETRELLHINEGDTLEIWVNGSNIVLKKHKPVICKNCEKDIEEHDVFCRYCGAKTKEE